MKKQANFSQSILVVAIVTVLLLLVPLVAMQFTTEVNWDLPDFIVMGALLFSIGSSYVLATRYISNIVYKIAIGFALGSTFLMIWSNLAVGLIGAGPNAGNLMCMGVVAIIPTATGSKAELAAALRWLILFLLSWFNLKANLAHGFCFGIK